MIKKAKHSGIETLLALYLPDIMTVVQYVCIKLPGDKGNFKILVVLLCKITNLTSKINFRSGLCLFGNTHLFLRSGDCFLDILTCQSVTTYKNTGQISNKLINLGLGELNVSYSGQVSGTVSVTLSLG